LDFKSRDKNKSAFKLDGFGPIYYINLDGQPERKEYMESQFEYWNIKDYTRVSAYDGREDDLSDIIKGKYPTENITSGEIGCVTSHSELLNIGTIRAIVHMQLSWKMIVFLKL
jgi:outer membrane cobalamin receptor